MEDLDIEDDGFWSLGPESMAGLAIFLLAKFVFGKRVRVIADHLNREREFDQALELLHPLSLKVFVNSWPRFRPPEERDMGIILGVVEIPDAETAQRNRMRRIVDRNYYRIFERLDHPARNLVPGQGLVGRQFIRVAEIFNQRLGPNTMTTAGPIRTSRRIMDRETRPGQPYVLPWKRQPADRQ